MSTHEQKCVVCEKPTFCCDDAFALGCGGPNGEGGCYNTPHIEFCSLACALELQRRLVASIENFHAVMKDIGDF